MKNRNMCNIKRDFHRSVIWRVAFRYRGDSNNYVGVDFDHNPTKEQVASSLERLSHSLPSSSDKEYTVIRVITETKTRTFTPEWELVCNYI